MTAWDMSRSRKPRKSALRKGRVGEGDDVGGRCGCLRGLYQAQKHANAVVFSSATALACAVMFAIHAFGIALVARRVGLVGNLALHRKRTAWAAKRVANPLAVAVVTDTANAGKPSCKLGIGHPIIPLELLVAAKASNVCHEILL